MSRVTDRNDWYDLWEGDKKFMLETMVKNMASDLEAGYDYFGAAIQRQQKMISEYKEQFDNELMGFAWMDEKEVNRWCFYDMKRRGVIE